MNNLEQKLFEKLTDLHKIPSGAFSLRKNGESNIQSSKEIEIVKKYHGIIIYKIISWPDFIIKKLLV